MHGWLVGLSFHGKQDSFALLRYAEKLNSRQSSGTLQSSEYGPTDMTFWAKSVHIFNSIRENGKLSIRRLADRA